MFSAIEPSGMVPPGTGPTGPAASRCSRDGRHGGSSTAREQCRPWCSRRKNLRPSHRNAALPHN